MTWFKVDDALHSHPKWLAASPAARALWASAGSWCASHLTDGNVPRHALPLLGGRPKDADELVQIGLWETAGDGWVFHDWAEFQPSAESVGAERAAARERQRRARDKARESRRDARRDARRDGDRESHVSDAVSHGPPDPTRPDLPVETKGGENLRAAPEHPPPRRCAAHADDDGPIPPCGACADARRTHDTWQAQHAPAATTGPLESTAAAFTGQAERNRRRLNDQACPRCGDTGWTSNVDDPTAPVEPCDCPATVTSPA